VEGWYPLAFGAITCFGLAHFAVSDEVFRSIMDRVMPTAISVAAILAGFQGAGQAVLLGILESGTISYLKRTGHYKRLVLFLWRAILLLFVSVILALVVLVRYASGKTPWLNTTWTLAILAGCFVWAVMASYRINWLMFRVLLLENGSEGRPPVCVVKSEDTTKPPSG
jgi:hypothetical protein